jgi:hypothetical protein
LLEDWPSSYRPNELFDAQGRLNPELAALAPEGQRRMGAGPHANGGLLLRDLKMPDYRAYAVDVPTPGVGGVGDTHVFGQFLRDVVKQNDQEHNFRAGQRAWGVTVHVGYKRAPSRTSRQNHCNGHSKAQDVQRLTRDVRRRS